MQVGMNSRPFVHLLLTGRTVLEGMSILLSVCLQVLDEQLLVDLPSTHVTTRQASLYRVPTLQVLHQTLKTRGREAAVLVRASEDHFLMLRASVSGDISTRRGSVVASLDRTGEGDLQMSGAHVARKAGLPQSGERASLDWTGDAVSRMSCLDVATKAGLPGTSEGASLDVTRQPLQVHRLHVIPHAPCTRKRLATRFPGAGDSSFLQVHLFDVSLTTFLGSKLPVTGRTGERSFTGVRALVSLPRLSRWRSVVAVRTLALARRLASWSHVLLSCPLQSLDSHSHE